MSTRVNRGKIRASVRVAAEVGEKRLLDAAGDSRQFVNCLLETIIDVRRIRACRARGSIARRRNVVESSQAVATVESNDRLDYAAAEEATAVVVNVKPEVDSGTNGVFAVDPRDVVHQLRRSYRTLRVG